MNIDEPRELIYPLPDVIASVGSATVSLFPRNVTDEERERFAAEDAERDRRRIPLGFVGRGKP